MSAISLVENWVPVVDLVCFLAGGFVESFSNCAQTFLFLPAIVKQPRVFLLFKELPGALESFEFATELRLKPDEVVDSSDPRLPLLKVAQRRSTDSDAFWWFKGKGPIAEGAWEQLVLKREETGKFEGSSLLWRIGSLIRGAIMTGLEACFCRTGFCYLDEKNTSGKGT